MTDTMPFTDTQPWRARAAGGYALTPVQRQAIRWLTIVGVVVSFVQMARYLKGDLPHFLVVTPESYSPHFWVERGWLQMHIGGGLIAFLAGPLQFIPYVRRHARRLHRVIGFSYIAGLTLSAVAGLVLAVNANGGPIVQAGAVGLSVAWLATTGMAVRYMLLRRYIPHARWMLRSYVTTLSFIWVRVGNTLLEQSGMADAGLRGIIMAWAGWLVPLALLEGAFLLHTATRRPVPREVADAMAAADVAADAPSPSLARAS